MNAGFQECDITPTLLMERPGGYGKAYFNAVLGPLKVRAAVFEARGERVALVGVDTCVLSERLVAEARERIRTRCGIVQDHVTIAASHTHSGGPLFGFYEDEFDKAPSLIRSLALEHSIVVDTLYHDWVVGQIVTAVCEADRKKEHALLSVGCGEEGGVVFNRRFRMANGRSWTHPGKMNPDILEPAGPIDPEVGVLAAWRPCGTLLGCVVNYACHGTAYSQAQVFADWIHFLEQTVKGGVGGETVTVFLNGACGDVTQVDNQSPRTSATEFGVEASRRVGTRVGAEVLKVLASAPKGKGGPVRAVTKMLRLGRRRPSPESVKRSLALVREKCPADPKGAAAWTFAKERLILDWMIRRMPYRAVEVQAVQVGPVVILSNPAEYFCQYGLYIKRNSPFPVTFVAELANGCVGYVPTEEAFSPSGGGYETVLTSYSNLEPSAGRIIEENCVALARRLKPGPMPREPRLHTASTPWAYGVLGPEVE